MSNIGMRNRMAEHATFLGQDLLKVHCQNMQQVSFGLGQLRWFVNVQTVQDSNSQYLT